jgi:hypothetical protein
MTETTCGRCGGAGETMSGSCHFCRGNGYVPDPTTVIHFHDAPAGWETDPRYVYIGRAVGRKGLKGSPWANPYKVGQDGSLENVLKCYRSWLELIAIPVQHLDPAPLRGKVLICWCAPQGVALLASDPHVCHGQILAEFADGVRS